MSGREIGADLTERSLTLAEFQFVEHLSPATYNKLRAAGLGPEVTEVVLPGADGQKGFALKRITPDARRAWHAMLAQLRESEEAKLAAARAQAQRVEAAKLAAQSPLHVSKQQKKTPRRKRGQ
jgi:hypothetical protein